MPSKVVSALCQKQTFDPKKCQRKGGFIRRRLVCTDYIAVTAESAGHKAADKRVLSDDDLAETRSAHRTILQGAILCVASAGASIRPIRMPGFCGMAIRRVETYQLFSDGCCADVALLLERQAAYPCAEALHRDAKKRYVK